MRQCNTNSRWPARTPVQPDQLLKPYQLEDIVELLIQLAQRPERLLNGFEKLQLQSAPVARQNISQERRRILCGPSFGVVTA